MLIFSVFMIAILSCYDVMYQKIPVCWVISFLTGACILRGCLTEIGFAEWLKSILPGGLLLLWGRFTRESIGYADGMILCGLGILFGFSGALEVILYAFFLAAVFSMIILMLGKRGRKETIAFVPFMGLGLLLFLLRTGGSGS